MQEIKSHTKKKLRKLKATEGDLETRIEKLYADCVGHDLRAVHCTFLDSLDLYILMEGAHSLPEKFLDKWGSSELAQQMRSAINQILKEKLNSTLETELSLQAKKISLLKPNRSGKLNILVNFSL